MDAVTIAEFLLIDLLLIVTPGADWSYVILVASSRGPVLAAVSGLAAGYVALGALTVAGIGVVVAANPVLLTALSLAGAAYLIVTGLAVLRRPDGAGGRSHPPSSRAVRVAVRGAAISGINPKGLLLLGSLLPQFIEPGAAVPPTAQAAILAGLHVAGCLVVYALVGRIALVVVDRVPRFARVASVVSAVVMVVVGLGILVERLLRVLS